MNKQIFGMILYFCSLMSKVRKRLLFLRKGMTVRLVAQAHIGINYTCGNMTF